MKIIIAPNAMKGSLSAESATDAIEKGILNVTKRAEIVKFPIAGLQKNLWVDLGSGSFPIL